jgi:hypothetical protein
MTARRAGRRSRTRAEREQWDRTPGDISAMMLAEQKRYNHYFHKHKGTTMILLQTDQMSDVLKPKEDTFVLTGTGMGAVKLLMIFLMKRMSNSVPVLTTGVVKIMPN